MLFTRKQGQQDLLAPIKCVLCTISLGILSQHKQWGKQRRPRTDVSLLVVTSICIQKRCADQFGNGDQQKQRLYLASEISQKPNQSGKNIKHLRLIVAGVVNHSGTRGNSFHRFYANSHVARVTYVPSRSCKFVALNKPTLTKQIITSMIENALICKY